MSTPLTPERILDTAEEVLRRFGPGKTTVVDVARALGVSHGSVYRHFSSKAVLRDAVVERWLEGVSTPLEAWVVADAPALGRLRGWLDALVADKRAKAAEDPELFATYMALVADPDAPDGALGTPMGTSGAVAAHVDHLVDQLRRIVADGVARAELRAVDPARTARAFLDATSRFHNPAHLGEWGAAGIDDELDAVWSVLAAGLAPPSDAEGSGASR